MVKKNPKYKPLYTSDKRYFIVTGGRNSGKSFEVSTFQTLLTFEQHHNILFTRYTMTSAGKSIIPELVDKIESLECKDSFVITQNDVVNLSTGSKIMFSGIKTSSGNQTANLKSLHDITTWVLDEAEEMVNESEFDKIDLSIRSKKQQNRVILVLNPTTTEHWIWKRWFENSHTYVEIDGQKIPISTHDDVCHIHTTYLDNIENIPKDYLKQILFLKENNTDKYKHIILGGWLNKAEGVVFENWIEEEFDNSLPFIYGMDFGYVNDPTTLVKVAVDKKNKLVYAHEMLYEKGLSTSEIEKKIKQLGIKKEKIVADSAEPRLIDDLANGNINIYGCEKYPNSVQQTIADLSEYKIIVTKEINNLKKELANYVWNDKKSNTPVDKWNHLIDALRYAHADLTKTTAFYFK
jgi:phage terminase large subunit